VYEMVQADEVLSGPDVSTESFLRSDRKPVDERHCERLMKLCCDILDEDREELANYQGTFGDFLTQRYLKAVTEPAFADVDPELTSQVLELFMRQQSSYFSSDSTFEYSGYGFTKFEECAGSDRNWKDNGYEVIIDYVTVSHQSTAEQS
jgi:hypothetical protein